MSVLAFQDFGFEGQTVRAMDRGGRPWFVAQDVCACLEIVNHRDALARLEGDEKGVVTADTLGGPQEMLIVSESGVYSLVFRSRKDAAKRFRKWVTGEVLPALRTNGYYGIADNDDPVALSLELPDEIERVKVKLALVRETRHVYGRISARKVWEDIGLPKIERRMPVEAGYLPEAVHPAVQEWFGERCDLDETVRTASTELYNDFKDWCEERDYPPWKQARFGRQLTALGIAADRCSIVYRLGVRLKA